MKITSQIFSVIQHQIPIVICDNQKKFRGVFIRAPAITDIGQAKPIAFCKGEIVGCMDRKNMALTFHPELTGNNYFHELWLKEIS